MAKTKTMTLKKLKSYLNSIEDDSIEVKFLDGHGESEIASLNCNKDGKTLYLTNHNYSEDPNDNAFDIDNIVRTLMKLNTNS